MASSKAVSSSALRNTDLRRKRSSSSSASPKSSLISDLPSHNSHHIRIKSSSSLSSMTVDNLLRNNVYGGNQTAAEITLLDAAGAVTAISDNEANGGVTSIAIQRLESRWVTTKDTKKKTVDDMWKEIVTGRRECKKEAPDDLMTLEDFLANAEAVEEEDVKVRPEERSSGGIYEFDSMTMSPFPLRQISDVVVAGFGNGEVIGGKGKRRALLEPLDKTAQQRQRRMIKNRESAARSRERKQAYQIELESLAVKLEMENVKLLKEKAERTRKHFKQLMEKVVPVVDYRRPPRVLRRVHSMQW